MGDQHLDRELITLYDVEDPGGSAGFDQEFSHAQARRRIAFGGFEHERVPARDGEREHPHRHHHRKIKGRHSRADAKWLTERIAVDVRTDVLGELAFEQVRNAAGEFDDLEAARYLTTGVGENLSMLAHDELGKFAGVRFEQRLVREQHAGAA